MTDEHVMTCDQADELDAALALGAVTPDERRAIVQHLQTCMRPHESVRSLVGAGIVLAAALEPVTPSPALRERVMRSVASIPQEAAAARPSPRPVPMGEAAASGRGQWLAWLSPRVARGVAAAALAAVVVLAIWNVTLLSRISEADQIKTAVAEARAVYPVSGEAGSGLLLDTRAGPRFLAAQLDPPPAGHVYVLWLIGADGVPVDVGLIPEGKDSDLVPLDQQLGSSTTFAVTVETARVDAPTTQPILVATIGGR